MVQKLNIFNVQSIGKLTINFALLKIDWQIHVYQVAHCAPVVVRSGKEGCVITAPHTWTHHRV